MKKFLIAATVGALLLTSCGGDTPEAYQKILSPAGAPAVAFYDQVANVGFETQGDIDAIKAKLSTDEYGMIVMDFFGGLSYSVAHEGHYKLAKILTGGNLHLVSVGEENKGKLPDKGDVVVSFAPKSLPALVYSKLFPEIAAETKYAPNMQALGPMLGTGKYEGIDVDYFVAAQPAIFAAMSNKEAATYGKLHIEKSLKDMWTEQTGQKAIPQAGLWVNTEMYEMHKDYFTEQIQKVEANLDVAIDNPAQVKKVMDEQTPEMADQKARLGFTSGIVMNVQKGGANGFALIHSDTEENKTELGLDDINAFLTAVDKNNPKFANYINIL